MGRLLCMHSNKNRTDVVRIDLDQCGKDHLLKSLDSRQLIPPLVRIWERASDQLRLYSNVPRVVACRTSQPSSRLRDSPKGTRVAEGAGHADLGAVSAGDQSPDHLGVLMI